jgi:hypothetical protein
MKFLSLLKLLRENLKQRYLELFYSEKFIYVKLKKCDFKDE